MFVFDPWNPFLHLSSPSIKIDKKTLSISVFRVIKRAIRESPQILILAYFYHERVRVEGLEGLGARTVSDHKNFLGLFMR
jgi:hypothetical protein